MESRIPNSGSRIQVARGCGDRALPEWTKMPASIWAGARMCREIGGVDERDCAAESPPMEVERCGGIELAGLAMVALKHMQSAQRNSVGTRLGWARGDGWKGFAFCFLCSCRRRTLGKRAGGMAGWRDGCTRQISRKLHSFSELSSLARRVNE